MLPPSSSTGRQFGRRPLRVQITASRFQLTVNAVTGKMATLPEASVLCFSCFHTQSFRRLTFRFGARIVVPAQNASFKGLPDVLPTSSIAHRLLRRLSL